MLIYCCLCTCIQQRSTVKLILFCEVLHEFNVIDKLITSTSILWRSAIINFIESLANNAYDHLKSLLLFRSDDQLWSKQKLNQIMNSYHALKFLQRKNHQRQTLNFLNDFEKMYWRLKQFNYCLKLVDCWCYESVTSVSLIQSVTFLFENIDWNVFKITEEKNSKKNQRIWCHLWDSIKSRHERSHDWFLFMTK